MEKTIIPPKFLELARFKTELKNFASGAGFDYAKKDVRFDQPRVLKLYRASMGFRADVCYPVIVIPVFNKGNKDKKSLLLYTFHDGKFTHFFSLEENTLSEVTNGFEWDGIRYEKKEDFDVFSGYQQQQPK